MPDAFIRPDMPGMDGPKQKNCHLEGWQTKETTTRSNPESLRKKRRGNSPYQSEAQQDLFYQGLAGIRQCKSDRKWIQSVNLKNIRAESHIACVDPTL
ncbi:hypothetical protein [Aquitalea sp.]|uniref:hypothetical protein n=1 Tax=Aquitalea sp. TaxID=1872623 RepID=UPI00258FC4AD|nr:hypothetical protein [Aquitalea sp.]